MGYVAGYITNSMLTIGFNVIGQSIIIQWRCKRVLDYDIYTQYYSI